MPTYEYVDPKTGRLQEMLASGQAPHVKGSRLLTTDEQTMKTIHRMEERGDFKYWKPRQKEFVKKVWKNELGIKPKKTAAGPAAPIN